MNEFVTGAKVGKKSDVFRAKKEALRSVRRASLRLLL